MNKSSVTKYVATELDPAFTRRASIILENLNIQNGDNILEIGCGRGFYGKAIAELFPNSFYTGIEKNPVYVFQAKQFVKAPNISFHVGDATKLPFPDKNFNKIICTEVLEHIENEDKALKEMHRVLDTNGVVMITVPNKNYPFNWDPLNWFLERLLNTHIPSHIWWLAGIWADHVRLYGEKELLEKMKKSNFAIDRLWRSTHFSLPFSHFLLYGIGKNIVEAGLCKSFNRFSTTQQKPSLFLTLITRVFAWFDNKNTEREITQKESFVNIIVKASKP